MASSHILLLGCSILHLWFIVSTQIVYCSFISAKLQVPGTSANCIVEKTRRNMFEGRQLLFRFVP